MANLSDRTSFYPAFYRVCFSTAGGRMTLDYDDLETARKNAGGATILACWYVKGSRWVDTEVVR